VLVDVPSDEATGVPDNYRSGEKQVADTRAVLAEVRKRAPRLPIFILTTSRSTLSGAQLGRSLGPDEVAGVVLTSSMIVPGRSWQSLASFDFKSVKVPLLFVQHRADGCQATPYPALAKAAEGFPLISVSGGKPAESGPCDPFAAHGYFGVEPQTVDAISAWILKKPFPTEVK
jgi:alpha-beta hydrolase superfamily lysophospholipase